jgi:bifunctional non-homologous end joining protein LigD
LDGGDGEIAALDAKGRSSFQLLQLFKKSGDVPLVYYVFDLLFLEDKDLRNQIKCQAQDVGQCSQGHS